MHNFIVVAPRFIIFLLLYLLFRSSCSIIGNISSNIFFDAESIIDMVKGFQSFSIRLIAVFCYVIHHFQSTFPFRNTFFQECFIAFTISIEIW